MEAFRYDGPVVQFPGHMVKALKSMKQKLSNVDMVLEVRDARIPFSSANPELEELIKNKQRLVIFNKRDLADPKYEPILAEHVLGKGHGVLFTSCVSGAAVNIKKIMPFALSRVRREFRTIPVLLMIMGVPNVGKSSVINALRRISRHLSGGYAKVGALPGVTRHISGFPVSIDPPAFLLDTPGITMPTISDKQVGLKLCLTGAIKDPILGEELLAEYLLHLLNHIAPTSYLPLTTLPAPTHDIDQLLLSIAQRNNLTPSPSLELSDEYVVPAAKLLLRAYRSGQLGRYTLDKVPPG